MTRRAPSYWPTADQTLLLRAGLLSGDDALAAWRQVEPHLDRARLDQGSTRLLPLVYANLRRLDVGTERLADLAGEYRTAWLWNQHLFQRATELVAALARSGIPALVLKGLALVMTSYRDIGSRPMADLDLLVPAARAVAAAGVLERSGFAPRHALTAAFTTVKHAAPFDGPGGEECDLHWRVIEESPAGRDDEAWWAASTTVEFQGARFGVLCPADQMLHVCVHGAKWAWTPGIRWAADAFSIARTGDIDWPRLVARARAGRYVLRTRETLRYLAASLGAAVPAETLAELDGLPVSSLERVEQWAKARGHGRLGELPTYWCHYLRARRGRPSPLGFARYLQQAWELESVAQVPRRALALARGRLVSPPGRPIRPRAGG